MTTFAILNVETGDFYSESPALKNEAKRIGRRWDNTSILPTFARRYVRFTEAIRRSQQLSNKTGYVCEVVVINDTPQRVAYLTGQRPADLLKLNRSDIRDGTLWFTQNKTGKKLRINIVGELETLIERILSREHRITGGDAMLQDGNGQRLTYATSHTFRVEGRIKESRLLFFAINLLLRLD